MHSWRNKGRSIHFSLASTAASSPTAHCRVVQYFNDNFPPHIGSRVLGTPAPHLPISEVSERLPPNNAEVQPRSAKDFYHRCGTFDLVEARQEKVATRPGHLNWKVLLQSNPSPQSDPRWIACSYAQRKLKDTIRRTYGLASIEMEHHLCPLKIAFKPYY
ncbi:hypothetical protein BT69DRAFT_631220 [Atractiella rhizophila]|nr:hypothetical protein BT69DRAFT_631220 [Atractiella rhizophila]